MKKLLSLLFVLFLLNSPIAKASHFMGGDITYECLGNNDYLISLTVYRDCNSNTSFDPFLNVTAAAPACNFNINQSFSLQADYPIIITPICEQEVDKCESFQDGVYGVQEFLYQSTITLPDNCEEISIGFLDCCRNNAISTITSSQTEAFYIGAVINTQDGDCNTSPQFNNSPTPFICVGQEINYNHGVTDEEGDELVFSLVDCASDVGVGVNYAPGFSGASPLTTSSLSIDPSTGAITFVPTALQVGVICVLVEEFRNGIKIGEVVRDIQFTVIDCGTNTIDENNLPILSGIDGTASLAGTTGPYNLDVCFGNEVCFWMDAFDADGHLLELEWNEGIDNASFNVNNNGGVNAEAEFCWTPTPSDTGLNFFTVTVKDDACDIRGINTYTFVIVVSDGGVNFTFTQDSVTCFGGSDGAASITLLDNFAGPSLNWPTSPPQTGLTANNLSAGNYAVTITDDSLECGSTILDITVFEREELLVNLVAPSQDVNCFGGNDGVLAIETNGGVAPYSYAWDNGANGVLLENLSSGSYVLTLTDDDGCVEIINYDINEPTDLSLSATTSDFNGFGISCTGGSNGEIQVNASGGVAPYTYLWSDGDTNSLKNGIIAGLYQITVTDANACSDSLDILLTQPTPLNPSLSNIPATCFDSRDGSIVITDLSGAVPPYAWSLDGVTFSGIDTFPIIIPGQSRGEKTIYISDDVDCIYEQLITVNSPDSLIVEMVPADTTIILGEEVEVTFYVNSSDSLDFQWSASSPLPCDSCESFILMPTVNTFIEVNIEEKTSGCAAIGQSIIRVAEQDFIFVPNVFTPNDDGKNDLLQVYGNSEAVSQVASFRIFDRWGGLVYEDLAFSPNENGRGWNGFHDGRNASSGVYVYIVDAVYINGTRKTFTGDVTLVR